MINNTIDLRDSIIKEINNNFLLYEKSLKNKEDYFREMHEKMEKKMSIIEKMNYSLLEEIDEKDKCIYERDQEIQNLQNKSHELKGNEFKNNVKNKNLNESEKNNKDDLEIHKIEEVINSPIDESIKEIIQDIDEEKTEVIDNEYDSSSEEEIIVSKIKHYNKEYYIIDGETPQYIYAINGDELGDKKGEIKNGKKIMYKNKL